MAHSRGFSFTSPKTHLPVQPRGSEVWKIWSGFALNFLWQDSFLVTLTSTRGTSAWERWHFLHLEKMGEALEGGFAGAIDEPKRVSSVLKDWSTFFQHNFNCSGGQSLLSLDISSLAQGKKDSHLWSHFLLDSMIIFAWIHIFKVFKYLINAQLMGT